MMESLAKQVRGNNYFGINKIVAEKYISSLELHIDSVIKAGIKLNIEPEQLLIHDNSKWSEAEFAGYIYRSQGVGTPDMFARAWLHHIHFNPHHWQHWIFPNNHTPKGSDVENGIVAMPERFALEMVADWMGASFAYENSWDMTDWLMRNIPKIQVHSSTAKYLFDILYELDYEKVLGFVKFGNNQ
jgi:hypothetical protein